MDTILQEIQPAGKIKLTISSVAAALMRGYNLTQIAAMHNYDISTVSRFVKRNYEELKPVLDTTDSILIAKSREIANSGFDKISDILSSNEFDKKDLQALTIATGTIFDKMRILQDKSTQNVAINTVSKNIDETSKQIADAQSRILELTSQLELTNTT